MTYKTIDIHGKQYMPVSERVRMAHDSKSLLSINTEVLQHNPVVIKATVEIAIGGHGNGTFTGISAANSGKAIEKASPYEVAETSAVGRALGFAGFGIVEGIASADEMIKAGSQKAPIKRTTGIIEPSDGPGLPLPDVDPF